MDFRILGPLEVHAGDGAVSLGGPKPRAVLAVLLLHAGEVVSTDHLIDALWGERPPETAHKALQVHVSNLRKALGPDALATRPPGYLLELAPGELDLHRFESLCDEARALLRGDPDGARRRLAEALSLWRGAPLAEFAYEPFAQAEIARLEELRVAALEDLIDAELALGREGEAAGELEALIAAHPLRERLRAQQMLALYRAGRQADALAAYRAARGVLTEELGIEPGRELRELHDAILRQDPALERRPAAPPADAHEPDAGFVGRRAELAELERALDEALAGSARVALVAGDPGIGKSRLAAELAARARARGARVLVGRCWEAGGAPAYWPWVQALRAYARAADPDRLREAIGRDGGEVATLLPELRAPASASASAADHASGDARFRLMEATAAFLGRAAAPEPIVLVLDDLHAADAPSLLLLRFLAAQLQAASVLVVGCYRAAEVGPELADALAAMAREPGVRRLTLSGLTERDTALLLEQTMDVDAGDELAARVHRETAGNPLFTAEIGRLLGADAPERRPDTPLPIPEGVREAIARRLERRSDASREVLAVASVMGREFDPDLVATASGRDEDAVFAALDEAAAAHLVEGVDGGRGRLRFAHILVRDALYQDLPAPRRMRLHRAIAEALDALVAANPAPHLAELAHHYLAGGTPVAARAVDYARRAGDRAASQLAYEEAARHYRSALDALEGSGAADPGAACELLLSLGDALSRAGDGSAARRALQDAAALAAEIGRPDQLARAALQYGGRFAWARASTDPALVPLLERALAAIGDSDPLTRVRLLARLAGAVRDDPMRERRVRLADEAIELARREGDPATLALALDGYWTATEGPDHVHAGIEAGVEMMELGRRIGDLERVFAGHDHRFHLFWQLADRGAVDEELRALVGLSEELRQTAQRWHVGTCHTMIALMEGRFAEAEELLETTRALGERAQSWNARVTHALALFVLRRAQGRLDEVEGPLARAAADYPALLRFRCAQAHVHAALGHDREARAALDSVMAHDLAREYRDAEWLFSMSLLAEPCTRLGDADAAARLHALLSPYEELYAQAPVEASFGSVALGLGMLATAVGRFDDADRHLAAAIEIERRMGARPWLAHAQHARAAALLERGGTGDAERARGLRDEASAAYRALGMRSWEARARELG